MATIVTQQPVQGTLANLFLKCEHLPDMDIRSKTDAQISVSIQDHRGKRVLGKTEVVKDTLNPKFATAIQVRGPSSPTKPVRLVLTIQSEILTPYCDYA